MLYSIFLILTDVVAIYAYNSEEPGDLVFAAGDAIVVTKKDGDWWTGCIDDRSGVFPANYVQPKESATAVQQPPAVTAPSDSSAQMNIKKPGEFENTLCRARNSYQIKYRMQGSK